ncbi:b(0,+)-type amino acid transporter 1-like isoform X1 [Saccostrea echinata]|uniref:b(0,+)-type amino acid transporter 1-like isoform X1 n=1 Tax=Saccostrea echinata TaxID=191078 RepID=UPI002A816022|nr:b(0,+)-type amino acid transporter 1-like isoform X1 [Saccostrea echinata]
MEEMKKIGKGAEMSAKLDQHVGLLSGVFLIMGTMIGSGIFISPKGVLEGTGSVGMGLITWMACGLVVTLAALCYAELGTMIPKSGGEHSYLMYTFGKMDKCLGPIPAFLYDWVGLFIIRPTMFAIMTLSLGTYAIKPFFLDCKPPDSAVKAVSLAAILIIAFINGYSVKMATYIQNICTVVKLIAISVLTVGGMIKIIQGNREYIQDGFEDTESDVSLIAIAFYNGLWAFDGWNNLNFVTEELKNPGRNLPISIMIGIPLTTVCYILANIGYLGVMSKEEIIVSHAVAVTWGRYMLGNGAFIMPIFVSISCFGAANGCLFASGRLCFAAAREGHFPQVFSYISINRKTPLPSIILTAFIGACLIIPGDLSTLIDFFSFSAWISYGFTVLSLLVLRRTEPKTERPYRVPTIIAVFVVLTSFYLVMGPIIRSPRVEFLYAALFIASGIFLYFPFVYNKSSPSCVQPIVDWVTAKIQKIFLVVP